MLFEIACLLVLWVVGGVLLICERSRRIWKRRANGYKGILDYRADKYGDDVASLSRQLQESKEREKSWREATARAEAEIDRLRDDLASERNKFEVLRQQTGFTIDNDGCVVWDRGLELVVAEAACGDTEEGEEGDAWPL